MTTMQFFPQQKLNNVGDATGTVLYGPSTQNKIERWWRELLERLEAYVKDQLKELLESGDYDPLKETDRYRTIHYQNIALYILCRRILKHP